MKTRIVQEPRMKDKEPKPKDDEVDDSTLIGEFMKNTSWLDTNPQYEMREIRRRGSIKGRIV